MSEFDERKKRENQNHYEKWLSCGYRGEMVLDDTGWCRNDVPQDYEMWMLFDKRGFLAYIRYMELPNGNWIASSTAMFSSHGYSLPISVWNTQYPTRYEAICAELERIEREMETQDHKRFVFEAIDNCRMDFRTDDLIVPIMQEQFEQLSMF